MTTARREPHTAEILLCYITDRIRFPGTPAEQQLKLLEKIAECAAAGVDYIQLREKDLSTRDLEALARGAVAALRPGSRSSLLINTRTDVALAARAHGVHLPAKEISASEARVIWDRAGRAGAVVGVSTHKVEEVARAEAHGADFALFAPIFEKDGVRNPAGLAQLWEACHRPHRASAPMPVLALGGITLENAQRCIEAGAAGIAAVRLFQEGNVAAIVAKLRSLRV